MFLQPGATNVPTKTPTASSPTTGPTPAPTLSLKTIPSIEPTTSPRTSAPTVATTVAGFTYRPAASSPTILVLSPSAAPKSEIMNPTPSTAAAAQVTSAASASSSVGIIAAVIAVLLVCVALCVVFLILKKKRPVAKKRYRLRGLSAQQEIEYGVKTEQLVEAKSYFSKQQTEFFLLDADGELVKPLRTVILPDAHVQLDNHVLMNISKHTLSVVVPEEQTGPGHKGSSSQVPIVFEKHSDAAAFTPLSCGTIVPNLIVAPESATVITSQRSLAVIQNSGKKEATASSEAVKSEEESKEGEHVHPIIEETKLPVKSILDSSSDEAESDENDATISSSSDDKSAVVLNVPAAPEIQEMDKDAKAKLVVNFTKIAAAVPGLYFN